MEDNDVEHDDNNGKDETNVGCIELVEDNNKEGRIPLVQEREVKLFPFNSEEVIERILKYKYKLHI